VRSSSRTPSAVSASSRPVGRGSNPGWSPGRLFQPPFSGPSDLPVSDTNHSGLLDDLLVDTGECGDLCVTALSIREEESGSRVGWLRYLNRCSHPGTVASSDADPSLSLLDVLEKEERETTHSASDGEQESERPGGGQGGSGETGTGGCGESKLEGAVYLIVSVGYVSQEHKDLVRLGGLERVG
jgi:hypothetical protein